MKTPFFLFLLLFIAPACAFSQVSVKDSSIFTPLIHASAALQMPGGDMDERFGSNANIGLGFRIKTRTNWIYGIEGTFIFGNKLKEDSILKPLYTKDGVILTSNGQEAIVRLFERGYTIMGELGKLINIAAPNPNSGILALAGTGFIQHKIKIDNIGNNVPALRRGYKKGYDRLTNGWAVKGFLGYMYLSNNRLINFYAGAEFIHAWTQNRRSFNFDTMQKDNTKRSDMLYGMRFGWIIPLYRKAPKEFYYY